MQPLDPAIHERLTTLSSDAATLRDGQKLAIEKRWSNLGGAAPLLWGECQGSAKTPYRTCLDFDNVGTKCTCPSRKFPCKHAMALALLAADKPELFSEASPPEWVATWQVNRAAHQQRSPKAETTAPDPAAQAQRADAREQKVRAGMQELRLWLQDLIRSGLTDDRVRTYEFWDGIAARMVDAQASGVGRRLRALAGIPMTGKPNWAERLLHEVSSLYLLADAYSRIDSLPEATQADIRTFAGYTWKQDELLTGPAMTDVWRVMGQTLELDERLVARRVWLHGEQSGRKALLLDFAFGAPKFDDNFTTGTAFRGALVFYPGAYPLRAILKQRLASVVDMRSPLTGFDLPDIVSAMNAYAEALAANPWVGRLPLGFSSVTPYRAEDRFFLRDSDGHTLPVRARNAHPGIFAAASGNQPIPVYGEWDGDTFTPLTLVADGLFWAL
jgi:hypothetical protein